MTFGARIALLVVAACGGRGAAEPYRTDLTPPWTGMGLPVAEGRVVYSDTAMLAVHYDGGAFEALAASWAGALGDAGLARVAESAGPELASSTWADAGQVVALGVIAAPERVEVSVSRYPKP